MTLFGGSQKRGLLGLVGWLGLFAAAGVLYGSIGFGAVMVATTLGLLATVLYQQIEGSLQQARLYREGGNHVMLLGLGLLWIGSSLDGWLATGVGLLAYALVFVGLGMIGYWWRRDWDEETTVDHDLDQ